MVYLLSDSRKIDIARRERNCSMHNIEAIETMNAERVEFIETLNQEFLVAKGYGVYAYLSTIDVIQLYESFKGKNVSIKSFVKTYIEYFNAFGG